MATKTSVQRQELAAKLKEGYQKLRSSEEFAQYLQTCARFHRYSPTNQLLIWMQRPEATRVAGYRSWQKLGRQVRKGEKGIQIFAPMPWAKKDDDGEVSEYGIFFKSVSVFDLDQTDGDELPSICDDLDGLNGGDVYSMLDRYATSEGLTIDRDPEHSHGDANGYYMRSTATIWIKPEASMLMATKTLAHEVAHHVAKHNEHSETRSEGEVVAESAAYIVLGSLGIDTGDYSYGYLASWADDDEMFSKALGRIHEVSGAILDAIAA